MFRKILTTVICLLLALMLPLQAMAATQHIFTVAPGDVLSEDKAVSDLLNVLSIKVVEGDKSGILSLAVEGTDMMSVAIRTEPDGVYIQSDAVSGSVLYFSWNELMELFINGMKSGSTIVDDKAIAEMYASLENAIQMLITSGGSTALEGTVDVQPKSIEESMALIKENFKNDPAMVTFLDDILKRIKTTDGEFTDAARDTATQKTEVLMTSQDVIALCNTQHIKNAIMEMVAKDMIDATDKEKTARVEELLVQTKEILQNIEMNFPITVYTTDEGKTLIGMEINMNINGNVKYTDDDGEVNEQLINKDVQMGYNRLTTDLGVSNKAEMIMKADGEDMIHIAFDYFKDKVGNDHSTLAMLFDDEQVTFAYDQAKVGEQTDRKIELYMREDATSIVLPVASDRPICSFAMNTQEIDDTALAAIDAATVENALHLPAMNAEDQSTFMTELQTRLAQVLMATLSKLPSSTLELLTSQVQQVQQVQ